MVDRQDIDALLIGSLYGELSSSEEARLTAHLESHPGDRTALANLTHAREVVRESRILQVQFDPPQSISALLIQEAVRRAPKPREEHSWFQRFMRSFMTHPAMAAAAMLVLIVGVAGTVYLRQGDHFAKQTKDDSTALNSAESDNYRSSDSPARAPTAAATPEEKAPEPTNLEVAGKLGQQGSGSVASASDDFKVQLRDEGKKTEDKVINNSNATPTDRARGNDVTDGRAEKNKKGKPDLAFESGERQSSKDSLDEEAAVAGQPKSQVATKPAPAKTASKVDVKKKAPRLDVTTPSQGPKDFESSTAVAGRDQTTRKGDNTGAGGATSTAPRSPASDPRPGNATPPPAPPPPAVAIEEKEKPADKPTDVAWAKEQHGKLIAAVKSNSCDNAAKIAVGIANRAPAYYASNIENDRAVKSCLQYIAQQREKEAERVQRAKATQRRATDEAPAPAPTTTK